MSVDPRFARTEELLDRIAVAGSAADADSIVGEIQSLALADQDVLDYLYGRQEEVYARLAQSKLDLAGLQAKLMMLRLADCHVESSFGDETTRPLRGPQPERLLAGMMLHEHTHELVPFDEEHVTRCLDPQRAPEFSNYVDVFATATGILRTATYFVLDARDSRDALASEPPEQDTFPPLPFPRVWIETSLNRRPVAYLRFVSNDTEADHDVIDVLGVGIVEISQGYLWDLYIAFEIERRSPEFYFVALRISPTEIVNCDTSMVKAANGEAIVDAPSERDRAWAETAAGRIFRSFRQLAVGGVHLICARNVPHEEIVLGRGQRKRIERLHAPKPSLYYVDLGRSGEHEPNPFALPSGRVYHVRWLVRGHWRHIDGGDRLCSCCEPRRVAVWIDPYIKGPVGAPWKGRPVHRRRSHFATTDVASAPLEA